MNLVNFPRPTLVFVTPDGFSKDIKQAVTVSKAVLQGGTSLIQIRDRIGSADDIANFVDALLSADISAKKLVINDMKPHDVAAIHPSLGIHIKESKIGAMSSEVWAEMSDRKNIVGCAVHSQEAAEKAMRILQPDYLQVGTMFPTNSHPGKIPEGPSLLEDIRRRIGPGPPLVAIGGIADDNVATVMQHGADGIALISLLSNATDPSRAALNILETASREYYRAREKIE